MDRLRASFTLPTDFWILDGSAGKVPALNDAFETILKPCPASFYVTVDDDYVIAPGWQDALAAGFERLGKAGILSPYYGDQPEMQDLMGPESYGPWESSGEVRYRWLRPHRHIPGGLLCFRKEVAVEIGPQPVTGIRYELYEDAWRGRRAQKLGWSAAYIDTVRPELITYPDPVEYLAEKAQNIQESRRIMHRVMSESGVADPLSWRIRRWVARVRGRARD